MITVLYQAPNNNKLAMVTRSGSHSIAHCLLRDFYPDKFIEYQQDTSGRHPTTFLSVTTLDQEYNVGVMVRNPIERLRSLCSKKNLSVSMLIDSLQNGSYETLYGMNLINNRCVHFKFENGFQSILDFLGIYGNIEHISPSNPENKPELSGAELEIIRGLLKEDIELWESL